MVEWGNLRGHTQKCKKMKKKKKKRECPVGQEPMSRIQI